MTHPAANDRGPATFTRLIAIELATFPDRINRALETIADARSPLRATSYETGATGNGGPDPGQTALAAQADHDRKLLAALLRDIDAQVRGLRRILNEWAPQPAKPVKPGSTIWCENHLRYGQHEPRNSDGSSSCRWCCDVHRAYGTWPTRQLVERHDRGYRTSDTEMRRLLGKKAS